MPEEGIHPRRGREETKISWELHVRSELESTFEERVQEAIKYASTIDDFDELVDPWTLAHHCLGSEPSHYVLRTICREEKKKMTTKFNEELLRVVEKEKDKETAEKGSSTPALDEGRITSLGVSIEEVTPRAKKRKTGDKGKEKVGASVWADAGMVLRETMHITSQNLANEEKAVVATSKVEALEVEASGLRKDLIAAMDANNTS
ncbi:hypothetical protein SO802_004709 [Lithocarpus litseifolius]|uniref:Uncharacterized protein n=1 Tax=Lithocarpus litseifolius TaxID=425828 RepID=A0AAW2E3Q6_9ROSI